jgi:hypothetical protein
LAAFHLHFRRLALRKWDYRVLLQTDGEQPELSRGMLAFDADGALAQVDVYQPLHFPDRGGNGGQPIALDFGTPTKQLGTGVEGVTSFDGCSPARCARESHACLP